MPSLKSGKSKTVEYYHKSASPQKKKSKVKLITLLMAEDIFILPNISQLKL